MLGVGAMFLGTFTIGIDTFILSPLLTAIGVSFHSNGAQIALGVTAYAIAYAVSAPVLAPLGDRFRPQVVGSVGILIFSAATLALTAQTSLVGFYAFRVLAGVGGAMWTPNVQAFISRHWARPRSTQLIGIVIAGLSAAIAFGVPLGAFVASMLSWQRTFLLIATLGILSGLALFLTLGREHLGYAAATRRLSDYVHTLTTPAVRWALLATLLWMTGFYGIYTFLGTFLQDRMEIGVAASGAYLIAYGIANFIASTTSGWVNTKLGAPHRPIFWFGLSSAVFVLLLSALPLNPILTIVLLAGWAASQGYAATGLITLASSYAGGQVATVLALNSSLIYVGTAAGSALFASFHGPAFLALGLPSAILTLLAAAAARRTRTACASA